MFELEYPKKTAPLKTKGCGTHGQTKSLCGELAQWYHPFGVTTSHEGKRAEKGEPPARTAARLGKVAEVAGWIFTSVDAYKSYNSCMQQ